jgi:hypothetical protein
MSRSSREKAPVEWGNRSCCSRMNCSSVLKSLRSFSVISRSDGSNEESEDDIGHVGIGATEDVQRGYRHRIEDTG